MAADLSANITDTALANFVYTLRGALLTYLISRLFVQTIDLL